MQLLSKIKQKLTQGFLDTDVVVLNMTLAEYLAPRLYRLAEMENDKADYWPEWVGMLCKMADAFDQYLYLYVFDHDKRYFAEAMELFSYFFEHLWLYG